jgi:hypothetical protein
MDKPIKFTERIVFGAWYLAKWVTFLLLAGSVFLVRAIIAFLQSPPVQIALALIAALGAGYVLWLVAGNPF